MDAKTVEEFIAAATPWEDCGFEGYVARDPKEGWGRTIIRSRDSDLRVQVNAKVIEETLQAEVPEEEFIVGECHHWACGWVWEVVWQLRYADGTPTKASKTLFDLAERVASDGVLDDEEYCRLEIEEGQELLHTLWGVPTEKVEEIDKQLYDTYQVLYRSGDGEGWQREDCTPLTEAEFTEMLRTLQGLTEEDEDA